MTEKRRGEGKRREKKKNISTIFFFTLLHFRSWKAERGTKTGGEKNNRKITARLFLIAAAQFFSVLPTSEKKKESKKKTEKLKGTSWLSWEP